MRTGTVIGLICIFISLWCFGSIYYVETYPSSGHNESPGLMIYLGVGILFGLIGGIFLLGSGFISFFYGENGVKRKKIVFKNGVEFVIEDVKNKSGEEVV